MAANTEVTLILSLFSNAALFCCTGVQSAEINLLRLVSETSCASASVEECGNTVGTAFGLRRRHFSIPKLAAIVVSASKQLLVKCSLHKTELLLGPCQLARVLCTPLVHCFRNTGSRGNVYRLTPSLYVLEQPIATQRLTISNLFDAFILDLQCSWIVYTRSPCDV